MWQDDSGTVVETNREVFQAEPNLALRIARVDIGPWDSETMTSTDENPDDVLRQAGDLVEEGPRQAPETPKPEHHATVPTPSVHAMMQKYCGIADSGVTDLTTNPKHMEDFGNASTDNP